MYLHFFCSYTQYWWHACHQHVGGNKASFCWIRIQNCMVKNTLLHTCSLCNFTGVKWLNEWFSFMHSLKLLELKSKNYSYIIISYVDGRQPEGDLEGWQTSALERNLYHNDNYGLFALLRSSLPNPLPA